MKKSNLIAILINPFNLSIIGFILPYASILLITICVRLLLTGTPAEKWASAGGIIIWLPIVTVILSALIIGINSIRLRKKSFSPLGKIFLFLSVMLITAGFQYFVGIIFFMQLVYVISGARH